MVNKKGTSYILLLIPFWIYQNDFFSFAIDNFKIYTVLKQKNNLKISTLPHSPILKKNYFYFFQPIALQYKLS